MSGVVHGRIANGGGYAMLHDGFLTAWAADGSWSTDLAWDGASYPVLRWDGPIYVSVDIAHALDDLRAMREHDEALTLRAEGES